MLSSTLIELSAIQRGCTINAIDCMYSKLPPEDEQLIYSKYIEDIYWNKLSEKVYLVVSYYARISQCKAHIMSEIS
jgi:hypothetical protein